MQCPYCKGKMETGRIMAGAGTRVYWLPNETCQGLNIMKSTIKGIEKVGGIVIAKETNNFSEPTTAYVCMDCKKIIANI